jgi:hypothetical protein
MLEHPVRPLLIKLQPEEGRPLRTFWQRILKYSEDLVQALGRGTVGQFWVAH